MWDKALRNVCGLNDTQKLVTVPALQYFCCHQDIASIQVSYLAFHENFVTESLLLPGLKRSEAKLVALALGS